MEGYVLKKATKHWLAGWQLRYAVLDNYLLKYFTDATMCDCRLCIDLSTSTVIVEANKGYPYVKIYATHGGYRKEVMLKVFRGYTEWCNALHYYCELYTDNYYYMAAFLLSLIEFMGASYHWVPGLSG